MLYRTVTVALGTLYKKLCDRPKSHDIIYWCTVSIGHERTLQRWKGHLNKSIKCGKTLLHADFSHVTVCCDRTELQKTWHSLNMVVYVYWLWLVDGSYTNIMIGQTVGVVNGKVLPPSSGHLEDEDYRYLPKPGTSVPNWTESQTVTAWASYSQLW